MMATKGFLEIPQDWGTELLLTVDGDLRLQVTDGGLRPMMVDGDLLLIPVIRGTPTVVVEDGEVVLKIAAGVQLRTALAGALAQRIVNGRQQPVKAGGGRLSVEVDGVLI
jgi:hypothetical protein